MSAIRFTPRALTSGVWHGHADRTAGEGTPRLSVWHQGNALDDVRIDPAAGGDGWDVAVPLSPAILSEGVQTVIMRDDEAGETLASLTLIAGEAAGADLRAEIDLLRAELDMLKRAFRRHCVETTVD